MRPVWAIGAALAAASCQPSPPSVEDAWLRLPAVPGRPAAAYAVIEGGERTEYLVEVTSQAAGRVELHETMAAGHGMGAMGGMRPVEQLAIPAKTTVRLAPGGHHLMLHDLAAGLRPGSQTPLVFRFDRGLDLTVNARIVAAGDPPPE